MAQCKENTYNEDTCYAKKSDLKGVKRGAFGDKKTGYKDLPSSKCKRNILGGLDPGNNDNKGQLKELKNVKDVKGLNELKEMAHMNVVGILTEAKAQNLTPIMGMANTGGEDKGDKVLRAKRMDNICGKMGRLQRQIGKLRENFKIVLYEINNHDFDEHVNDENTNFESLING